MDVEVAILLTHRNLDAFFYSYVSRLELQFK